MPARVPVAVRACVRALAYLGAAVLAVHLAERARDRWRDRRSHYRAQLYLERARADELTDQLRNVIALAPYARRRAVPRPPSATLWPQPTRKELRK